ncbi:MAG: hypothetical protein GY696_31375 [Gammaproteobacteria bacterium]|nr:hypothetical protein [Gammaproteobacteria bacterium]
MEKRTTTDREGLDTYILVAIIVSSVAGGIGLLVAIYIGYRVKKSMDLKRRRELAPPRLRSHGPTDEQKAMPKRDLEALRKQLFGNADAKEPWTQPTESESEQTKTKTTESEPTSTNTEIDGNGNPDSEEPTQTIMTDEATENPDAEEPKTQSTMTESEQANSPRASINTEVDVSPIPATHARFGSGRKSLM